MKDVVPGNELDQQGEPEGEEQMDQEVPEDQRQPEEGEITSPSGKRCAHKQPSFCQIQSNCLFLWWKVAHICIYILCSKEL